MKAKLARGESALGVSVMVPCPQIVEMLARIGFDWVLLDCEHGTFSPESVELMTIAAEASALTALARPRTARPEAIQDVLERGVLGVQVPHVKTPEDARAVVEAVKYHPMGRRSLAARTRPAGYGLSRSLDEFAQWSNEETLVCIQIEEEAALANLDAMLEVAGIDVFFLGPSDLSQAFGFPGRAEHPDVRRAMDDAFATIVGHGRSAGSAGSAADWRGFQQRGATYLYTHLPALLAAGSGDFLSLRSTN